MNTNIGSSKNKYVEPEQPIGWKFWKRKRYIVTIMLSLGLFNAYTMRTNLSVGIVAMTELKTVVHANGTISMVQDYSWDSAEKGIILSAFFYGYILTNLLGGYLGYRFGGSHVMGFGIGITSVLTCLTPLVTSYGKVALIVLRILMGMFEGISVPPLYDIQKQWTPPNERSLLMSIIFAGSHIGTVISMIFSGIIAQMIGWPSIFYIFGFIGILWYGIYLLIIQESPAKDRSISVEERCYIEQSLENLPVKINVKIPWKSIFKCQALYAVCVANITEFWGFFTLLTQLPTYLKDVMHFNILNSGVVSSMPYVTIIILTIISGWLADYLLLKNYLKKSQLRRIFTSTAFIGQAISLIIVSYIVDPVASIFGLCFAVGMGSFIYSGHLISILEMAPYFSSIIGGITNTFGMISAIAAPALAGFLTKNGLYSEWRVVFFIAAGIYIIGAIVFSMWGSSKHQSWAIVLVEGNDITANKPDIIKPEVVNQKGVVIIRNN